MNKVMLIGNVGAEPEYKQTPNGVPVANVRLATTERGYTTASGQQVPERTEWHTLIFWRKQADAVHQYVHKGDKLYVEGKIQSRKYEKDGVQHEVKEIYVDNMEFLSQKQQAQPQQGQNYAPQGYSPAPTSNTTYQGQTPYTAQPTQQYGQGYQNPYQPAPQPQPVQAAPPQFEEPPF